MWGIRFRLLEKKDRGIKSLARAVYMASFQGFYVISVFFSVYLDYFT